MKTLEEFTELFAEQFDETEKSEITSITNFRDLEEWSSIIGMSVMAMVSQEFGVILSADDIRKSNTPNDIYNIIKSK